MLKSTLLLATALFLITAPAPDAADLAEATRGLIANDGTVTLEAAETARNCASGAATAAPAGSDGTDLCPAPRRAP